MRGVRVTTTITTNNNYSNYLCILNIEHLPELSGRFGTVIRVWCFMLCSCENYRTLLLWCFSAWMLYFYNFIPFNFILSSIKLNDSNAKSLNKIENHSISVNRNQMISIFILSKYSPTNKPIGNADEWIALFIRLFYLSYEKLFGRWHWIEMAAIRTSFILNAKQNEKCLNEMFAMSVARCLCDD